MSTRDDVRAVVEQAILDQPRSLQQEIGPSELGTECDRCLGHKLAGTEQRREAAWLPYIGTAVHAQLERVFAAIGDRWVEESNLWVGDIDGREIWGSCDLFDYQTGTVVDFKTASANRLKMVHASGAPSHQYRVQAHLYGRGWEYNGAEVRNVAIWYLPRNAGLHQSIWWEEPYDEQVALDALARADAIAKAIRVVGADAILPTLARHPDCYECPRYPAYPTDPPLPTGQKAAFADLIPA